MLMLDRGMLLCAGSAAVGAAALAPLPPPWPMRPKMNAEAPPPSPLNQL